jgi:hypothetical protein
MPKRSYPAINPNPEDPIEKEKINNASPCEEATIRGVASEETEDYDAPELNLTSNEKAIRKGNASIKLGKDRHTNRFSGAGGKGHSHCAAIDIVAGNLGFNAKSRNNRQEKIFVDPDFKLDAARIYLSQRSDVDSYFGLNRPTGGGSTSDTKGFYKSTVALKADTIRVIARDNIRLVTRTDQLDSQGGELSNGDKSGYGIDLIACNDPEDLQPMVKGENLKDCLLAFKEYVDAISTILENFIKYQKDFNRAVQKHTHMSPFYGSETAPDFKGDGTLVEGLASDILTALNCEVDLVATIPVKGVALINDYLENSGAPGDKYILSLYNRTN